MIIGITGLKNSGKDTAAQYLVDKYEFERMAFADTLKEAAGALFNVSPAWIDAQKNDEFTRVKLMHYHEPLDERGATEHAADWSMREFLQRMGTEMGRHVFGENFWIEQAIRKVHSNKNYVIPDVRFTNEAQFCNYVIEINRQIAHMTFDNHVSELGIRKELIDYIIPNNGTIEELHRRMEECLTEILDKR